jgi:acetolactate synthase II small subunit
MTEQLTIQLQRAEGSLVRLLGLTERRGFPMVSVHAIPTGADSLLVQLTVRSERPIEKLTHQLAKLYEVQRVEKTP